MADVAVASLDSTDLVLSTDLETRQDKLTGEEGVSVTKESNKDNSLVLTIRENFITKW